MQTTLPVGLMEADAGSLRPGKARLFADCSPSPKTGTRTSAACLEAPDQSRSGNPTSRRARGTPRGLDSLKEETICLK